MSRQNSRRAVQPSGVLRIRLSALDVLRDLPTTLIAKSQGKNGYYTHIHSFIQVDHCQERQAFTLEEVAQTCGLAM